MCRTTQGSLSASMKGRSCLINLISYYDQVTHLVHEGRAVDVVYHTSATTLILSHGILLEKLPPMA